MSIRQQERDRPHIELTSDVNGTTRVSLISCPACGAVFEDIDQTRDQHIGTHDPGDFGQSISELLGQSGGEPP